MVNQELGFIIIIKNSSKFNLRLYCWRCRITLLFFGDKHKSNQNVFRPSCSSSTRYAYYLICVCLLSSPAIATLYHGIASAGPTCSYVIRLCAAILDLTLRSPRCDVTDLAARPPENKDVILHQYTFTNQTLMYNKVSVRYNVSASQRKTYIAPSLNMVSKNWTLTAIRWSKMSGPWVTELTKSSGKHKISVRLNNDRVLWPI